MGISSIKMNTNFSKNAVKKIESATPVVSAAGFVIEWDFIVSYTLNKITINYKQSAQVGGSRKPSDFSEQNLKSLINFDDLDTKFNAQYLIEFNNVDGQKVNSFNLSELKVVTNPNPVKGAKK